MSELLTIGLNHRTAPLAMREKMNFRSEELTGALAGLAALPHVEETMLLSTCNRVELYTAVANAHAASQEIRRWLSEIRGVDAEALTPLLYEHVGPAAVRHLFRVTCSVDSMVVGEPQITGQVKEAYSVASAAGTVGALLHRSMHRAFSVAKRVRNETSIGRRPVSMSSIAVDLARHVFGELSGRRIVLIGAGKMSQLAARQLYESGSELWIVNRSMERAITLARDLRAVPRAWEDLEATLIAADIVLTATGSPAPIIDPAIAARVVRARHFRPLVVIDIAMPRDVDPRVGDLENVYLFDLDALQSALAHNLAERGREAQDAETLIESETTAFLAWLRSQASVPTIKELRDHFTRIARAEEQRLLSQLPQLGEGERRQIRLTLDALVNKLLHAPLAALKSDPGEPAGLVDAARRLFDLRDDRSDKSGPA